MTNLEFAKKWAETRHNDLSAHRELYAGAEEFCIETRMVVDHLGDTISTDSEFTEQLAIFTNKDPENGLGVQSVTVTEAFEATATCSSTGTGRSKALTPTGASPSRARRWSARAPRSWSSTTTARSSSTRRS